MNPDEEEPRSGSADRPRSDEESASRADPDCTPAEIFDLDQPLDSAEATQPVVDEGFESTWLNDPKAAAWLGARQIPEQLYSEYEGGPFRKCLVCEEALGDERLYQIQKTYRGSEVVIEMAVCERCGRTTCDEFSQESMGVMQRFVGMLVDALFENEDSCGACGSGRDDLRNYSVVGLCCGSEILLPPITVCEACEQDVQDRLSKTTRDRQGEFIRDNFPGVPADLDLAPLQF